MHLLENSFDPAHYPRTYRPSLVLRLVAGPFSGLLVVIGMLACLDAAREPGHPGASTSLLVTALGSWLAVFSLRYRVVLAPTFIERRLVGTRRILRSDITSFSRDVGPDARTRVVTYRIRTRGRRLPVAIMCIFAEDRDFKSWFAGFGLTGAPSR